MTTVEPLEALAQRIIALEARIERLEQMLKSQLEAQQMWNKMASPK